MDGLNGSEAGMMQYLQDQHHHGLHHHMGNGTSIDQDEQGDNDNIGKNDRINEVMDGDVAADLRKQSNPQGPLVPQIGGSGTNNQLTLSFQGQVYVFDSVSPEKVNLPFYVFGLHPTPGFVNLIYLPFEFNMQLFLLSLLLAEL